MKKFFALAVLAILFATSASAWTWGSKPNNSDQDVAVQLENLVEQSNRVVGMPSIVNFFEKSMVRMLYEMRDNPEYRTHSYIVTMTGQFVKICDSIGYGINASIQYSNPEKMFHDLGPAGRSAVFTPQAEPNGLFMPEGLAATYVMCLVPGNNNEPELKPVYVEPEVIVSPFELSSN